MWNWDVFFRCFALLYKQSSMTDRSIKSTILGHSILSYFKRSFTHQFQNSNTNSKCNLPDKPVTPTLTSDTTNPVNGQDITLTCTTATVGVTSYEFRRGGLSLAVSASNTYTIFSATIGADDGSYTCSVVKDTISSDASIAYFMTS